MKKLSLFTISIILMFFYAGFFSQTAAQGIRNEGATINIASGYVVCQGGLVNSSGTVTNDGTLIVTGGITNSASNTIGGEGNYYIGGDWVNNGTFIPGSGTVTFNGANQTINGTITPVLIPTVFNNLAISSSTSTTISSGYAVTVNNHLATNDKLKVESLSLTSNGSLIVNGTSSGNVTYDRTMPAGSLWHYVSSPVSLTSTPEGLFYAWNELAGDWDAGPITSNPGICRGYTLQTTGNSVSFTGSLVPSATITATSPYTTDVITGTTEEYNSRWANYPSRVDYGGGGWNLLGNPFTSAMKIGDADGFLEANDGTVTYPANKFDPNYVAVYIYDGSSYYYRGKTTGFVDPVQSEIPENLLFGFENIQAGQGFFVLAMKDEVTFTFDISMQTHGTSTTMLKSAEADDTSWPGLRLKVKYGEKESSTLVIYNENMSADLDPGYDVGQLSVNPDVEIYTSLVVKDNSVNFSQQALPVEGCEKNIIPVGIDSEKGGEVTFSSYTVPIGDIKFWLEDLKAGTFTNLNSSTYTVTLPAKTFGTGRFYIIASVNTPTGTDSEIEADGNDLRIWTYDSRVIIKGTVSERALCEIYDTGGRKVVMIRLTDGELNIVAIPSASKGVYLVRVVDGGKVTTRKVALL